jgi:hypothetical protein
VSWFWAAAALSAAAAICYFVFEAFRELLLDVVSDWLYWIIPGAFISVAAYFAVCAIGITRTVARPAFAPRIVSSDARTGSVESADSSSSDVPPNTEPERQNGLRIVIIEAAPPGAESYSQAISGDIETELEKQFRTAGIRLLAEKNLRAQLIVELQKYQKGRSLYEPATLKQVEIGHFHGATYGVFWSITQQGDAHVLECRLIRLRTSEVITTTSTPLGNGYSLAASVQEAATSLLSEISEITFVVPKKESFCGGKVTAQGWVTYLPRSWTLWITIVPEGISNHFPQRASTVERNGSFTAP